MTDDDIAQLIEQGHETNGVEFKSSGSLGDAHFRAKLVRAILAFANRRDSGVVVVGVSENRDKTLNPTGVTSAHAKSWDFDRLSGIVSGFADPSVELSLEVRRYKGRTFRVIVVSEFAEVPVLCKKDHGNVLRQGGCYVRSLRKPESREVAFQEDMRAVIGLATDKAVARWVGLARHVGLVGALPAQPRPALSRYDEEVEGLP
ncbi:MAG TPA: RNA-binding domain-containing protein [Candidatus Eisenbacteria bacterium]|jgi:hypothetical protein